MKKKVMTAVFAGCIALGSGTAAFAAHDQIADCINKLIGKLNPQVQQASTTTVDGFTIDSDVAKYLEDTYGSVKAYADKLKKDSGQELSEYYILQKAALEKKFADEEARAKSELDKTKEDSVTAGKAKIDAEIDEALAKACAQQNGETVPVNNNGNGNNNGNTGNHTGNDKPETSFPHCESNK